MAKAECRPERKGKTGRRTVKVRKYKRTPPTPIRKKCKS